MAAKRALGSSGASGDLVTEAFIQRAQLLNLFIELIPDLRGGPTRYEIHFLESVFRPAENKAWTGVHDIDLLETQR